MRYLASLLAFCGAISASAYVAPEDRCSAVCLTLDRTGTDVFLTIDNARTDSVWIEAEIDAPDFEGVPATGYLVMAIPPNSRQTVAHFKANGFMVRKGVAVDWQWRPFRSEKTLVTDGPLTVTQTLAGNQMVVSANTTTPYPVTLSWNEVGGLPQSVALTPGNPHTLATRVLAVGQEHWVYQIEYIWAPGAMDIRHARVAHPLSEPVEMTQGPHGDFSHQDKFAYDWAVPEGTVVRAMASGWVIEVEERFTEGGLGSAMRDQANYIHIIHADGSIARYVHLMPDGADVSVGTFVTEGEPIGRTGNTGFSSAPHLHVEIVRLNSDIWPETIPVTFFRRPTVAQDIP